MRRSKLTIEQRRQLSLDLHKRKELLQDLAQLSLKRLGAKYGVHHQTIWRLDELLHGYHIPDPVQRRNVEPCAPDLACA